jgi:hypothetical protein
MWPHARASALRRLHGRRRRLTAAMEGIINATIKLPEFSLRAVVKRHPKWVERYQQLWNVSAWCNLRILPTTNVECRRFLINIDANSYQSDNNKHRELRHPSIQVLARKVMIYFLRLWLEVAINDLGGFLDYKAIKAETRSEVNLERVFQDSRILQQQSDCWSFFCVFYRLTSHQMWNRCFK